MTDEKETKEKKDTEAPKKRESHRGGKKNTRRRKRTERPRSEFDHKVIDVRRVTRVVSGGRRFSFSATVVIGDRQSRVGVGVGKAGDTALAIEKAIRSAKKSLITLNLTEERSLPHELQAKFKASFVEMRPAPGRGLVAGSSVRDVMELAGVKDVSTKLHSRSKNKLNNARAAHKALSKIKT